MKGLRSVVLAALLVVPASGQVVDWVRQYDGFDDEDKATAIAVDDAGGIYVAGYSDDGDVNEDIVVVKWTSTGHREWVKRHSWV